MNPIRPDRPPAVLAACIVAVLLGLLDAVDTVMAMLSVDGTGAIIGTLLRDALLIAGAFFAFRGESWGRWTLTILFALGLLRTLSAGDWIAWLGVALAGVGFVLMVLPATRRWFGSAWAARGREVR